MKTGNKILESVLRSSKFISKYNEATSILREIDFEYLMFILGSPLDTDYSKEHSKEMLALMQAESIGWYKCLDMLFNFLDNYSLENQEKGFLDFGAKEKIKDFGYIGEGE